jgi:hypothetical protein
MLPSPAAERRKSANLAPGPSANELRSPARSGNRARVNLQPAQSPAHRQRGPPNQHFETPQGFRPRCRRAGTAASIAERADCRSCRRATFSCRRGTTTSARRRSSACGRTVFSSCCWSRNTPTLPFPTHVCGSFESGDPTSCPHSRVSLRRTRSRAEPSLRTAGSFSFGSSSAGAP